MKSIYYHLVRLLAKLAVQLFYHPIEINRLDNIPRKSGHLIFAPNHQSAFLDAILVAVYSTKPIYFLTRADVFVFPFKYFLYSLNMMPVYRQRDGYKTLSKNDAVFQTCKKLVQNGKPVLLFPEASQELVHYLRPLTRGLSRIAYLCQDDFAEEVNIIPVGLNYFDHVMGGTKLIINFGEPISVREIMATENDKNTAINSIREHTSQGIKNCMMIPDNDANYNRKLNYLNRAYYDLPFESLRKALNKNPFEEAEPEKPLGSLKPIAWLLEIINLPYFLIKHFIIYFLLEDKCFYASIKVALLMFLCPLTLLACFIIFSQLWGNFISFCLISVQIIALVLRFRLEKYFI